jgi:DNA-binding beta-propeller fold protein YncE
MAGSRWRLQGAPSRPHAGRLLGFGLVFLLMSSTSAGGEPAGLEALEVEVIAESGVGDGHPATSVPVGGVDAFAVGRQGQIYFADSVHGCLREIGIDGMMRTVLRGPVGGVAVDQNSGAIYAIDRAANRVRVVRGLGPESSTVPEDLNVADGEERAVDVKMADIAVGGDGRVYIADSRHRRVLTAAPDGLSRAAGVGTPVAPAIGAADVLGAAGGENLLAPEILAAAPDGSIYSASRHVKRIQKLTTVGTVEEVLVLPSPVTGIEDLSVANDGRLYANAGGVWRLEEDGWHQLTPASAELVGPLAVQGPDLILFNRADYQIVRLQPGGNTEVVAGNGTRGSFGDGGPANGATFSCSAVAIDAKGKIFFTDPLNRRVAAIDAEGNIDTVIGPRGLRSEGSLSFPAGLAVTDDGTLYVADLYTHRVFKLESDGTLDILAGTGEEGLSGDGGPATAALLRYPNDVRVDSNGGVYILDSRNMRVRYVDHAGVIQTAAEIDPGSRHEWEWPLALFLGSGGELFVTTLEPTAVLRLGGRGGNVTIMRLEPEAAAGPDEGVLDVIETARVGLLIPGSLATGEDGSLDESLARYRVRDAEGIARGLRDGVRLGALDPSGHIVVCDGNRILRLRRARTK